MTDNYCASDIEARFAPLPVEVSTPCERDEDSHTEADGMAAIAVRTPPARLPRHRAGAPSRTWHYVNEASEIVFLALRFDKPDGKSFAVCSPWRSSDGEVTWSWRLPPGKRPLYRLDEIARNRTHPVVVCEGEKAADAAMIIFPDHIATTWSGGANAVAKTDFDVLAGRNVTIWPDNDPAGIGACERLTKILQDLNCHVSIIDPEAASSMIPDCLVGSRPAVAKWDAADAKEEWSDFASLREALMLLAQPATRRAKYRSHGDFTMTDAGLTAVDRRRSSAEGGDIKISKAFEIVGRTRDPSGNGWGRLVRWYDTDLREHAHFVADADLHGDVSRLSSSLAAAGLKIERARGGFLADYINGIEDLPPITIVRRTGWHDIGSTKVFVLPSGAVGQPNNERIELVGNDSAPFASANGLADWRGSVAALAHGHSRHMFAIMASFAGPLLEITGCPGFGVNFFGSSSTGKTTAVQAGASVWGSGSINGFVRSWRSTGNALEALAAMHSDAALVLDELGQVEGRHAGMAAYQFSAGTGKGRSQIDGSLRNPQTFRTVVLSTGEVQLRDKVVEDGGRPMAGQTVRFLEIPADANQGYGSFEHGGPTDNAKDLADALKLAARTNYGTAGPAFVRELISRGVELVEAQSTTMRREFGRQYLPSGADGQVQRVADHFALVAFAGEFAIECGVLPWKIGDANNAAGTCFQAWLDERGHAEPDEIHQGIERVRVFIQNHGGARFEPIQGPTPERPVRDRAGYWRGDGSEKQWLIFPNVWSTEVLQGYNVKAVTSAMYERGILSTNDKYQTVARICGKQARFYAVKADILSGSTSETGADDFDLQE